MLALGMGWLNTNNVSRFIQDRYALLTHCTAYAVHHLTQDRFYVLTPESLHSSVLKSLSLAASEYTSAPANTSIIISTLLTQLVEDHPEASFATDFQNTREWVLNNAGGAMGSMFIIHASITECVTPYGCYQQAESFTKVSHHIWDGRRYGRPHRATYGR